MPGDTKRNKRREDNNKTRQLNDKTRQENENGKRVRRGKSEKRKE
jgi:hypothetical protein